MLKNDIICKKPFTPECVSCGQNTLGFYKSKATYWAINSNINKLNLVDKFIAVSNFVKEEYQKHLRVNNEKICVLPNFYSPGTDREQSSVKIDLPDDFILFVGTFSLAKGVDILIEAYRRIKTDVKLVLIGIKHSGFNYQADDRIIVLENQPHHIVMEAWRRCRFGVVPSVWPEPCPTVALEAMACGKALVASNIGSLKDIIIDGWAGFLVPPGNASTLAEAMKKLISNPNLAKEWGKRGKSD